MRNSSPQFELRVSQAREAMRRGAADAEIIRLHGSIVFRQALEDIEAMRAIAQAPAHGQRGYDQGCRCLTCRSANGAVLERMRQKFSEIRA